MIVTAYSTLRQDFEPDFSCKLVELKSRESPDLVGHLNSVMGWACDFGKVEMTPTLFAVLQHLERTRHWYQFEIEHSELEAVTAWGIKTNSIFGMPDRSLRDPNGAILVDRENDIVDEEAYVPHPSDAAERSRANRQLLADRGIEVMEELPPTISEEEVILRTADEVGWRMLALFIVAVRAESVATGNPITAEQLRSKSPMSFESLTHSEQAFLNEDHPDQQTVVNFAWRYEALYALQWSLGLHTELKSPTDICDVPGVAETMVDRDDRELITETRLRPVDELLDALDLNYQMLWAARHATTQGRETPGGLDGGVLVERQHALNWLIRFAGADWDDVDTPS